MADILLVYGTDTNNTESIAQELQTRFEQLGLGVELTNITDLEPETLLAHSYCVFGIPTWDFGGIQADWEAFEPVLRSLDFSQHQIAIFGLGDQFGYGDFFIDAVGWLHEILAEQGGNFYGYWPTKGYDFNASRALLPDGEHFMGLAIDEDQQFELTEQRLAAWVELLKTSMLAPLLEKVNA